MLACAAAVGFAAPARAQPAPPPNPGIFVELLPDDPRAHLDIVPMSGANAITVCWAPCRRWLDRGAPYVIQGDGIVPTSTFLLPDTAAQVALRVKAGSRTRQAAGMVMAVAGGAATLLGFSIASLSGSYNDERGRRDERRGLIVMAIGAPVAIIGILLARSAHTVVTSSTGAEFSDERPRARARPRLALTADGLVF